ncbi:hypothetical protein LguiB_028235 [Lonicera macranthoides]
MIREGSPISALNLKKPGPITSLLQSYTASTTCNRAYTCQTKLLVRHQEKLTLQIVPDHSSKTEELFSYHYHQLLYQSEHDDSSG